MHGQCTRVERTLDASMNGEIELLRSARVLRRIHGNLRGALTLYARRHGWTREAAEVQGVLDTIESDLRHVLLGYPHVRDRELRARIRHACDQSLAAIQLLDADVPLPERIAAG
jgi:hypothetical protein